MNTFWICFGCMGLMFIPVILMFLICGCTWSNKISGAIVCLVFWVLFSGAFALENKRDHEAWNNGICSVCEGEYNFSGATKYFYYYTCDDCGHTIGSNQLME